MPLILTRHFLRVSSHTRRMKDFLISATCGEILRKSTERVFPTRVWTWSLSSTLFFKWKIRTVSWKRRGEASRQEVALSSLIGKILLTIWGPTPHTLFQKIPRVLFLNAGGSPI